MEGTSKRHPAPNRNPETRFASQATKGPKQRQRRYISFKVGLKCGRSRLRSDAVRRLAIIVVLAGLLASYLAVEALAHPSHGDADR